MINALHERFTLEALTAHIHLHKRAVLIEWDSCMVEQEAITHQEEATMLVQHTQVLLNLLGLAERALELLHEFVFLLRKCIWIARRNGRQESVGDRICLCTDSDGTCLIINLIQEETIIHLVLGMTENGLSLKFELDDGNGLVHLGHELCRAREARIVFKVFGLEDGAWIIAIGLHSEVG